MVKRGTIDIVGKGSMISVYKIQPSYNIITIQKLRGTPAPGAPMFPTPMYKACMHIACIRPCMTRRSIMISVPKG
jgi:hypothetical protein